ncbi:glycosyltransferase family 2 protein [Sneathiella sp.]|uniref:glycosyltransferase family 2 protein n=1 Tax=Sneathiella sp. TaxID=1964365 RepID=UPI002FDF2F00
MKISIVVPTRNRAEFLKYCLETCLMSDDPDIEVIVSDNNSIDDTAEVVAAFKDARLRYVHPGRDLSMRQNFEFALSHASGDYVIFIGDDDGVIPNGIATLRHLLDRHAPDVVIWRHITYIWPHVETGPKDGLLKFRYRDFCGPLKRLDPKAVFADFCAARLINYRDAANIYHGCVARRVIERVKAAGGEYFQGQIPDVNSSLTNLTVAESLLWVRNPVTIAGAGEKSNGTAMNAPTTHTEKQTKIVENFTALAEADQITPEIDLKIRSIPAYVYANLMRINRNHLGGTAVIDHARWREVVIADMRKFPKQHRCWDVLEDFFCEMDPAYRRAGLKDPADLAEPLGSGAGGGKKRASLIKPEDLKTVSSVVAWIQKVTGKPYYPPAGKAAALLKQGIKAFEMRGNLARLSRGRSRS